MKSSKALMVISLIILSLFCNANTVSYTGKLKNIWLMSDKGKIALVVAAVISIVTAIAHFSCIFIGPACFEARMAPAEIVDSAANGTMLAPIATLIISGLFISYENTGKVELPPFSFAQKRWQLYLVRVL